MKQTIDLMKPRYKVIADYPANYYGVGEIYTDCSAYTTELFEKYPHLFKKLEWWEEREESEMPEYVKEIGGESHVVKVANHYVVGMFEGDLDGQYWEAPYNEYVPATEAEYQNYLKTKS